MTYDDAILTLKKYGQEHLLEFYDELDKEEQVKLLEQIENIDFEYAKSLFENREKIESCDKEITSFEVIDINKTGTSEYERIGDELIRAGKIAICSMAGGQGTRLGFDAPKITYPLKIGDRNLTIAQTIIDKLNLANKKFGTTIYWYIMTSNQNNQDTITFFEKNNYFDYDKEHIVFFVQGELPLLDSDGKIVLASKNNIFMAPDGNGGIFNALGKQKILGHMRTHGIEYLSVGNVDNILINLIDPIAFGIMCKEKKELLSKSFMKPGPDGKWGVFCKVNGKLGVIEYIETPRELLEARNHEGELIFGDAHFGCNFFMTSYLERIDKEKLPMHLAIKKNTNLNGEVIDTYKFEAFIFDSFAMTDKGAVLRVDRESEFAPIKNKEGDESPKTAIELYKKFYNIN